MEKNLLSVIVLAYGHNDLLYETLDSVFMQNYPAIELIVAEDGSPDFVKEPVEEYITRHAKQNITNSQIIVQQNNVGTVRNINNALKSSNGEYIKIIAGDDTYPADDVFSAQVDYLKSHPDVPLVVGNVAQCDHKLKPLSVNGFAPDQKDKLIGNNEKLLRYICKKNPVLLATQAICYTRSFFVQNGLFDQRCRLVEDLPMAIKIITSNIKFGYMDMVCVNHRGDVGISTSSNAFDSRKIAYYTDLKNYYENCIVPIKSSVGRLFTTMRYKLMCFRISYTNPDLKLTDKICLLAKYSIPILYYTISKFARVKFYLQKDNKK